MKDQSLPTGPRDPELDALLQTWAEAEADEITPLLVLADWLQERNDPRADLMRMVADPKSHHRLHQEWFRTYWPDVIQNIAVWPHVEDETSIHLGVDYECTPLPEAVRPLLREGWIHSLVVSMEGTPWFRDLLPLARLRYLDLHRLPTTREALERVVGCRNLRGLKLWANPFSADDFRLLARLPRLLRLDLVRGSGTDQSMVAILELTGLRHLGISNAPVTDQFLVRLRRLKKLEGLTLYETEITDVGIESLRRLPGLKRLNLTWVGSADRGAQSLSSLHQLEELQLLGKPISDQGLASLSHLSGLKSLTIDARFITDEGLKPLGGMKKLERLILYPSSVTPLGIFHLRWLPELKQLSLCSDSMNDEMVGALSQFPHLEILNLEDRITDRALHDLPRMKHLRRISFFRSPVSGEAIVRFLSPMNWVRQIWFHDTELSPEELATLRKALPDCEIIYDTRERSQ